MLSALFSLIIVFALLMLGFWGTRWFFAWLGRGKEAKWLVDGNHIEARRAEGLRQFFNLSERDAAAQIVHDRALPTRDQRAAFAEAHKRVRDAYLKETPLTWYQLVVIFLMGSVIGLALEQLWMFASAGLTESRVGLVWGPYSPLYGFGAVLFTLVFWPMLRHGASDLQIFLAAALAGGLLEHVTGWSMETFAGAVSWDYTAVPGCITKWVAVPFLFFWGLLGLVWAKQVMPELLYRIGMPTTTRQAGFITLLAVYLAADIFMTMSCFGRMAARDEGVPPANAFEAWVDENYTDEFIAARFQNMVIERRDGK